VLVVLVVLVAAGDTVSLLLLQLTGTTIALHCQQH